MRWIVHIRRCWIRLRWQLLNDADADGVCDEFEIAGCTDAAACNYDADATDDDGSCLELDECGVCGGDGIAEGACDCEGNTLQQAMTAMVTASLTPIQTVFAMNRSSWVPR